MLLALSHIHQLLAAHNTTLTTNLPAFDPNIVQKYSNAPSILNPSDQRERERQAVLMYHQLNPDQRVVYDFVMHAAQIDPQQLGVEIPCYFVDGPGGTGKTFLYNCLIRNLQLKGIGVLAVSYTGIAARLLLNGRTSHTAFRIPIPIFPDSVSTMKANSKEAAQLKKIRVIVWDEAPMVSKDILHCVNKLLQDVCQDRRAFGGKVMLLGGDFRQVLPVLRRAGKAQQLSSTIKQSSLWSLFKVHRLSSNMRAGRNQTLFADWLLKLGNGSINLPDDTEKIELPEEVVLKEDEDIIDAIYEVRKLNDPKYVAARTILTPYNEDALSMNEKVLEQCPGDERIYFSIDGIESEDKNDSQHFPPEFLNSLIPSGMPPHELKLKVHSVVVLLRNLTLEEGLCNGTRLVIKEMKNHSLKCEILGDPGGVGGNEKKEVILPRIELTPSDSNLPFILKRRQFPIRLAYAMTINKSQGQTFDKVGLYLPKPVFSHGQLYVAFSRVRAKENIKVKLPNQNTVQQQHSRVTNNIVYKEVLS
jgi:ATP-dependent DNA helicase PIF1